MPKENNPKHRFLVIGLDGASFNLIQPWLDEGSLPNFQRLIDEGVCGELDSCVPPVTMPAWRVYTTGKQPGKLGVFWHQQLDPDTLSVLTPNSTFFHTADFWDYLNAAGMRTGILGMPDTFPPRKLDGFLVAGPPSAATQGYTYPADLAGKLENIGYQPFLKADFNSAEPDSPIVKQALDLIQHTFDAATFLLEREAVDFFQVVSFDINRFQHFFFDGEPTKQAWQIADTWLGQARGRFEYVMVMSDHGVERLSRAFFPNVWLRQNGYLTTRFQPTDILPRLGINRNSVGWLASRLGITRLFSYETLLKYGAKLPTKAGVFGEFASQSAVQRVDWRRTRAFALPQGPIYINRALVPDEVEYEALRDRLIAGLEELRDPDTDTPLFRKVYRREEAYDGPFVHRAPHLLALSHDAYHNRAGLSQANVLAEDWRWKGNNRQHGLFILDGPNVRKGMVDGARIVDLAPTILHLCGVAVPQDMDGRVLTEVFEGEAAARSPQFQKSLSIDGQGEIEDSFDETVRSRLENLGYL